MWQWVAPECTTGVRPSFASDTFSLGMCIVEAVRVVEATLPTHGERRTIAVSPWGNLDIKAVKVHVTMDRSLPLRPCNFADAQWEQVTLM